MDKGTFIDKIDEHDLSYIQLLYLPNKYVLRENEEISKIKNKWNLCLHRLESFIKIQVDKILSKSQMMFDTNKYVSLKNIIHVIRFIQFGIQIITDRRIIDYSHTTYQLSSHHKIFYEKFVNNSIEDTSI